jgi:transposase-like protein
MIVEVKVTVHTCPKCDSENLVKNGHDYKGAQKYRCDDCGSYGTLEKKSVTTRKLSNRRRTLTLNA